MQKFFKDSKGSVKTILLAVVIVASIIYISILLSKHKKQEFEKLYESHVSKENKATCKGKNLTCKEFYLGHALYNKDSKLSLKYLKKSYENNITALVDDWSARDNYLAGDIAKLYANLGDYKSAIAYSKKSIEAGEPSSCELGRYYDKLDMLDKAKKAFEKSIRFYECKFYLGTYYYNGRGVKQDKLKGVELWKGSYKDDKFGKALNFNLAIYYTDETNDLQKYKYHLLKAVLLGEKKAKSLLNEKHLKNISASERFINEAVSKNFYYTPNIKGYKFSYGFNLYYRFKEFHNKNALWYENYDQKNAVEFEKNNIKIRFELQELSVKADLKKNTIYEFIESIELVILSLHVDTSNIPLYSYLDNVKKQLEEKKILK